MKTTTPATNIRPFSAWLSLIFFLGGTAYAATLDNFDRPDGPVGGKWVGGTASLTVSSGLLKSTAYTSAVYDSVLGKDQSVSGIWSAVGGSEQDLLLKSQGAPGAHIEVRYDANTHLMRVAAYNSVWVNYAQWPWTLLPGDTVTATCDSLGMVGVSTNRGPVGVVSVASWPYAQGGGRVGITMGTAPRLDAIAVGGFTVPTPSPYVTWRWTWPSLDEQGFVERRLKYGTMYQRPDTTGTEWQPFFTLVASKREGKLHTVSLTKAMVWGQLGNHRTRFYVTATDSMDNEAMPSNEVVRSP